MWQLLETIHALTYFATESVAALQATGLRGFWMAYFAARSAPMGPASVAVVEATFFNFSPRLVRRAIPDAWSFATPDAVLEARWAGAAGALSAHTTPHTASEVRRASELLSVALESLTTDGRALAAANAALPMPDDPLASLWQRTTTLREHRGDAHVAALVCAGLTGLEAHLTLVGAGVVSRAVIQDARGFTDAEWDAAHRGLVERDVLGEDGTLSVAGAEMRRAVEALTDSLALAPWAHLGEQGCDELEGALRPLAASISATGVIPALNPMGLPKA
jgi:hypothetical protein